MLLSNQQSLSQISRRASLGLKSDTQSIFTAALSTNTSIVFGNVTTVFNNQLNDFLTTLNAERTDLNSQVLSSLKSNPHFNGLRNRGVSLAWKYEQADVLMGGHGTVEGGWNDIEIQQIKSTGKAKVYDPFYEVNRTPEGHHINNVADHPELQANPDNIRFYRTREDHVNKGHGGNTSNPSEGELIDKNEKLRQTNRSRVIKNELSGIAIAAGIGFAIGFTLSTIAELATKGISSVNLNELLLNSTKAGFETAIISSAGYGVGRLVTLTLQKFGVNVLGASGSILNFSSIGLATIAVISIYQYAKLRLNGYSRSDALNQIGKQTLFSISMLTVSIIAQGIYGGYAGLIVSTSMGIAYFGFNISRMISQREKAEKLRVNTIIAYKELVLD